MLVDGGVVYWASSFEVHFLPHATGPAGVPVPLGITSSDVVHLGGRSIAVANSSLTEAESAGLYVLEATDDGPQNERKVETARVMEVSRSPNRVVWRTSSGAVKALDVAALSDPPRMLGSSQNWGWAQQSDDWALLDTVMVDLRELGERKEVMRRFDDLGAAPGIATWREPDGGSWWHLDLTAPSPKAMEIGGGGLESPAILARPTPVYFFETAEYSETWQGVILEPSGPRTLPPLPYKASPLYPQPPTNHF